jgi:general secretion pathway protein B
MSFILDALRKSEIERQRQSGPSMAEFPVAREDRRLPVALVVIGFLLAVNLAVVLFFLLRDGTKSPPPATAPAATSAAAQATAPRGAQPLPAAPSPLESEALSADEYETEPPAVYYEPPVTEAPGAPDPTLLPRTDAGAGVEPGVTPAGDDFAAIAAATGLPQLTVDLHVYATDPAKRAVFINGHRYTRGARMAEGPLVEDITPDGALLSYRGRRFLLPRL